MRRCSLLPREDAIRLRHMLDAARDALAFAEGRGREDLDNDRLLNFGLVRAIEVIGEAASKVTSEGRAGTECSLAQRHRDAPQDRSCVL